MQEEVKSQRRIKTRPLWDLFHFKPYLIRSVVRNDSFDHMLGGNEENWIKTGQANMLLNTLLRKYSSMEPGKCQLTILLCRLLETLSLLIVCIRQDMGH